MFSWVANKINRNFLIKFICMFKSQADVQLYSVKSAQLIFTTIILRFYIYTILKNL